MKNILLFCKENKISIQALLDAAYLKASLELLLNNMKEADIVNFQIIYDGRSNLTKENNEKCVCLFVESTYSCFPVQFINKWAIEIAKELIEHIKKTNSIESEDYKRFMVKYYYIHKKLYFIDYTLAASDIGNFKSMEDFS